MTALYLDEAVRLDLAATLQAMGYEVHTTLWENRLSTLDPDQLLYAVERGWAFVTHNREDYKLLHRAWTLWGVQPPHAGILVLEQLAAPQPLATAIDELLRTSPTLTHTLYLWWERGDGWSIYEL